MTYEIQVYEHEKFGELLAVNIDGMPWFSSTAAASALNYENPYKAIIDHCKYPKLFKPNELEGLKVGSRGMKFINEFDLYRLIMRSNMKKAVDFQDWVFEEVLPAIRKTGKYEVSGVVTESARTLSDEQCVQVRNLVSHKVHKEHVRLDWRGAYRAIYRSINDQFGVDTYRNVPAACFVELIEFVNDGKPLVVGRKAIDEIKFLVDNISPENCNTVRGLLLDSVKRLDAGADKYNIVAR